MSDLLKGAKQASDGILLPATGGEMIRLSSSCEPLNQVVEAEILAAIELYNTMQWQPIETAPKDGTDILVVLYEDIPVELVRFSVVEGCFVSTIGGIHRDWPIKWMPLPPMPEVKG